jgi:transposase
MDECLPLGSLDAPTLRMLLEKDRIRRRELEQEVTRLLAGIARQNAVIAQLEQEQRELRREHDELHRQIAGLTEQNAHFRHEVATLTQENAQLRGLPLGSPPPAVPETKPATPQRQQQTKDRKKRASEHNRGRLKRERANRWETHAAEQCPHCGTQLTDGWIHRRVQVIDLPDVAPLEITEHRIIRRQCPTCGKRVLPPPVGLEAGRIGQCRFGPRLIAALATMDTVEHLPGRMIQERLKREYNLCISHGGIVGLLHRMAQVGRPVYDQLQQDVRASPVVNADETSWRENGQRTTVWTTTTAQVVYVHHGRRTNEEIDGILGVDFAGTIVADCYASYDHFEGPKQRCWAHLVRDLDALLHEQAADSETVGWVEGIRWIYHEARQSRPAHEEGWGYQARHAREQRARQYESLLLLLCPKELDPQKPYASLATRLRKHLHELFTFVRDPRVDDTNNAAERSLRPLVIARKVSGGTRSGAGSTTTMILYSLAATATMQGKDPTAIYQQILLAAPGTSSPLAVPASTR